MLSSHLFFCLLCLLPPFALPCNMVLARPDERETCPYHFSLSLFTMVRSSCSPIACWILAQTSSLVTRSLYEIHRLFWHTANQPQALSVYASSAPLTHPPMQCTHACNVSGMVHYKKTLDCAHTGLWTQQAVDTLGCGYSQPNTSGHRHSRPWTHLAVDTVFHRYIGSWTQQAVDTLGCGHSIRLKIHQATETLIH